MATTFDGKIAKDSDHFPDWTGKADKKLFVEITKQAGVIIMGSKTYDTIGRPLPGRKNIVITRNTTRTSDHDNLIFTQDAPQKILQKLSEEGFSQAILIGGAKINTLFAKAKVIDELIITIAPLVFGEGLSLFEPEIEMQLQLEKCDTLGENSVCVQYKIIK